MKRILKYILLIGLGVLFIWLLVFLYGKSVTPPDEFATEKPKKNNVVKKTVANGKIVPRKEILIKPVVSGIIRELYVEAGQLVKKDQPLAKIQIVPDMLSLSNAEQRVKAGEIAVQFKGAAFPGEPEPGLRRIRFPAYDASHAVSLDQPQALRDDVAAWLAAP